MRLRLRCAKYIKIHVKDSVLLRACRLESLLTCCGSTEHQDADFVSAELIISAGSVPCLEGSCAVKEGLDLQRASFWRGLYFTKGQDCCPQLNAMVDVGPYQHLPFFFFFNVMF